MLKRAKKDVIVLGKGARLDDPQRKIIDIVIPNSDRKGHFWCFGTTRVGKAQPLNSKIHTPDGWKCIGEIKKGDHYCPT